MGDIRTRCPPIRGEEHRALLSRTDFLWILFSIDKPESKSQAPRPRQAKSHPKVGLRAVTIILRSQFYNSGLVPINCKSSLLCSKTSYTFVPSFDSYCFTLSSAMLKIESEEMREKRWEHSLLVQTMSQSGCFMVQSPEGRGAFKTYQIVPAQAPNGHPVFTKNTHDASIKIWRYWCKLSSLFFISSSTFWIFKKGRFKNRLY